MDDPLLSSALALAATTSDGLNTLHSVVMSKFIVERISSLRTLEEAQKAYAALGENQFSNAVVLLDEKKARSTLKRLDKHYPEIAAVSSATAKKAIAALAASQAKPHPAPRKANQPTVAAAPLPDVRAVYKEHGTAGVSDVIGTLSARDIKRLIAEQELKADAASGPGVGAARKFVQLALKAELGTRGDPIGALQHLQHDKSE